MTWPDGTPLVDGNGDGILDLGAVDSATTANVRLVVIPNEELGELIGAFDTTVIENRFVWIRTCFINDTTVVDDSVSIITVFQPPFDIHNYPNPFSGATTFAYTIPRAGYVSLRIYNRAGEHIRTLIDEEHYPLGGVFEIDWNGLTEAGNTPAPGVYLYVLQWKPDEGGGLLKTKKIIKKALMQP